MRPDESGTADRPSLPLSVIVPAYRCAAALHQAVAALRASDLPRDGWELIVVDDASGDDTAGIAAADADRVVVLEPGPRGPHGPAYARSRGSEVARGAVLAFVDADVCVYPDALRLLLASFGDDPTVGAVFGAYDTSPTAPGVVSRYANLVHHYVHATSAGDAETFWAGCGAVRRDVFRRAGGFDERRYLRPQIEDIELGHRIRDLGYRILLRPEIRGRHLKRWTLWPFIVASVRDRGIPWVELLLQEGGGMRASTLNLRRQEKIYTALVGLAAACAVAALVDGRWLLVGLGALAVVLAGNGALLRWLWRIGGPAVALAGAPLRILYYGLNCISVIWGMARYVRRRPSIRATARSRRDQPGRPSDGNVAIPPAVTR